MGYMVSNVECPECKSKVADESLHNSLDYKEIECYKCGYKKCYEREWGPWTEVKEKDE